MKTYLFVAFSCVILLLGYQNCDAQTTLQNISPTIHNRGDQYKYVLINEAVFKKANIVDTERPISNGKQQLSIINIQLPLQEASLKKFSLHVDLAKASTMLITLAIIPDETDNQVHWKLIKLDTLTTERRVAPAAFIDTCFHRLARYRRTSSQVTQDNRLTRSASVRPIIYRDGQYWTTSNYTLTELFLICPAPFVLPYSNDNITINTLSHPYSNAQLEQEWKLEQKFHQGRGAMLNTLLASKILLSEKVNDTTYDFITFSPNIVDGSPFYTGAGDFRYQKDIGIIYGSYSQHLLPNTTSKDSHFVTKQITHIK